MSEKNVDLLLMNKQGKVITDDMRKSVLQKKINQKSVCRETLQEQDDPDIFSIVTQHDVSKTKNAKILNMHHRTVQCLL